MDERIYSKNIIEFVTVSAEYCAFIERVPELEKEEFLDKIIKILPLLYLKATLLTPEEPEEDGFSEKFVTENMYESVRENIESLLGEDDSYLEVFQNDMKYINMDVKDLATIAGFSSAENFSDHFRRKFELKPSVFIKMMKDKL